jgi:hypothetical protein
MASFLLEQVSALSDEDRSLAVLAWLGRLDTALKTTPVRSFGSGELGEGGAE